MFWPTMMLIQPEMLFSWQYFVEKICKIAHLGFLQMQKFIKAELHKIIFIISGEYHNKCVNSLYKKNSHAVLLIVIPIFEHKYALFFT